MDKHLLTEAIQKDLGVSITSTMSFEEIRTALASKLSLLISNDFNQLISILYRLDISETKLKNLLKENPGAEASYIIADLIIERQIQKIKSRQQFRQRDNDIDENEKW